MGLAKNLKNLLFPILKFCFHEACLGVDLRRCACAMNMADSAFEKVDVGLFSRGIRGVVVACFVANGPGFVSRPRAKFANFFEFSRYV